MTQALPPYINIGRKVLADTGDPHSGTNIIEGTITEFSEKEICILLPNNHTFKFHCPHHFLRFLANENEIPEKLKNEMFRLSKEYPKSHFDPVAAIIGNDLYGIVNRINLCWVNVKREEFYIGPYLFRHDDIEPPDMELNSIYTCLDCCLLEFDKTDITP